MKKAKSYLVIVCCLFGLTLENLANTQKSTLIIELESCYEKCLNLDIVLSLEVFVKNEKIYTADIDELMNGGFPVFELKNLRSDLYLIKYTNLFGQHVEEEVIVNQRNVKKVICVDVLHQRNIKGLITTNKIGLADTLTITQNGVSTCHGWSHSYSIKLYLNQQQLKCDILNNDISQTNLPISEGILDELKHLEAKVKLSIESNPTYSTVIETFTFKWNKDIARYEDDFLINCDLGSLLRNLSISKK